MRSFSGRLRRDQAVRGTHFFFEKRRIRRGRAPTEECLWCRTRAHHFGGAFCVQREQRHRMITEYASSCRADTEICSQPDAGSETRVKHGARRGRRPTRPAVLSNAQFKLPSRSGGSAVNRPAGFETRPQTRRPTLLPDIHSTVDRLFVPHIHIGDTSDILAGQVTDYSEWSPGACLL